MKKRSRNWVRVGKMAVGLILVLSMKAEAVETDHVAHAGISYAITHGSQALCNRIHQGEFKTQCLITGVVVGLAAGIAKEAIDHERSQNSLKESFQDGAANALGIGLAVTLIQIDF